MPQIQIPRYIINPYDDHNSTSKHADIQALYMYLISIMKNLLYCRNSNISHTSVGNKFVDHSDEVGASPVSAAPTTSSFST